MNQLHKHPVIFFDGVCNVCNRAVQWILRRDRKGIFRFASLQSRFAKESLIAYSFDPADINTVVLLKEGRLYTKSDAALQILKEIGGGWRLLAFLGSLIPGAARNLFYDILAKYRYRWFGRKEACIMPQPEWKKRFLDG